MSLTQVRAVGHELDSWLSLCLPAFRWLLLEASYVTCMVYLWHWASLTIGRFDDDFVQNMAHNHNQVSIVLFSDYSGLEGDVIVAQKKIFHIEWVLA